MRGGGKTGCDVGGKQAAVCVHVNTQGGGFRGDEAYFALQSTVLLGGYAVRVLDRSRGQTAVMAAAVGGHTGTLEALARLGADVKAAANVGRTAVMYAAMGGHTGTVEALASNRLLINPSVINDDDK